MLSRREKQDNTALLVKDYNPTEMVLYHGSSSDVERLLPPSATGNIRDGEEERKAFKDVIFLTNDFELAKQYAGDKGIVYAVKAKAIIYRNIASDVLGKRKMNSVKDNIFISEPNNVSIIARYIKDIRKKNEPQKYFYEFVGS